MAECNVKGCEKPGTQLLRLPQPKEGEPIIVTMITLSLDGGSDLDICTPAVGPEILLCVKHYDEIIEKFRELAETDHDGNDRFREIVKLN